MTMTAKPMIQSMLMYHYDMNERVYQQIALLTHEDFVAETTYSIGSLRNHMVHLLSVDMAWLNGLQGHPREHFAWLNPKDFATFADVHAYAQRVKSTMMAAVADWSDTDFAVMVPGMRETRWQVLVHLVTHGVDHRAQMLQRLDAFNVPTMPQDFIMHIWRELDRSSSGE